MNITHWFIKIKNKYSKVSYSWKFSIAAWLSLRAVYAIWGIIIVMFYPLSIQNFEYVKSPIVSIFNLHTSQTYLYNRTVDQQTLTFRSLNSTTIVDLQTGSHWNIASGKSEDGFFIGKTLSISPIEPEKIFPYLGVEPYPDAFLSIWQRFDANWYLSIAQHGYGKIIGDSHFPPLFPYLIRLVGFFTGDLFLAGLLISHIASFFVIKLLYDMFHEWQSPPLARRSLVYFLIFPASFFLFSVYSESLFILLVLMFFRTANKKAWILTGTYTLLAILTRLQGLALMLVLLYLMYQDKPFLKKISHWLGLGLASVSGIIYPLIRYLSGSSSVLPTTETEWQTRLAFPWESYKYAFDYFLSGKMSIIDFINLFLVTVFLIIIFIGWKKIPSIYLIYVVFSMLIMTSRIVETQPFSGMIRFSLSLFPVFALFGLHGQQPLLRRLIAYAFLLFMFYLSAQFWTWGWVS